MGKGTLTADPGNADAIKYLATVERGLSGSPRATQPAAFPPSTDSGTVNQPTAFANGRYQVKKFLGEGGKKKVYLAQALTEGWWHV
ncbi:MAG: hypothetical protein ACE1ZD_06125 [Dehalococcoidia bacterium]